MTFTMSRLFLIIAVVLFLIATLLAAGAFSGDASWLVPGGLASFALSFLVP